MTETTIVIGKRELRIEYDGSMVDIECVCGVVHEMAENALCFCETCGADWETRTSIGELVLPDYTEVCFYRLIVIQNGHDVSVLTNEPKAEATFAEMLKARR